MTFGLLSRQTRECIPDSIHQVLATQGYFSRARVVKVWCPHGSVLAQLLYSPLHLVYVMCIGNILA